ncbi:MAG: hypothetical protein ACI88A_002886 [Paraglaciecola sp.]|jgi:hypothetical protein
MWLKNTPFFATKKNHKQTDLSNILFRYWRNGDKFIYMLQQNILETVQIIYTNSKSYLNDLVILLKYKDFILLVCFVLRFWHVN